MRKSTRSGWGIIAVAKDRGGGVDGHVIKYIAYSGECFSSCEKALDFCVIEGKICGCFIYTVRCQSLENSGE